MAPKQIQIFVKGLQGKTTPLDIHEVSTKNFFWIYNKAAYLGLVRPLLEYASQAWDPYTDNLSNEIEKTQRRAARFVTSDY